LGIYSDLIAGAKSIDFGGADGISHGAQRAVASGIAALQARQGGDVDYPSGYAAVNEVQSIAIYSGTVSGGNFTLTVTLKDVPAFTTANIAHSANAATIEAAIDTAAAAASVPGFVASDISISGGPLTTTPLTITYDGASVAGKNHAEIIINGAGLTGGGTAGDESVTTEGQTTRSALAVLFALGVLAGAPPVQDESGTVTAGTVNATNPAYPGEDVIRALAAEAAVQDRVAALETNIILAAGLDVRSPR